MKIFLLMLVFAMICTACSDKQSEPSVQQKINDTGITWGGNYPRSINEDCSAQINQEDLLEGETISGDILSQQDCMHGRDVTTGAPLKAGFSYQKIDASGKQVSSTAKEWHCVIDKVSGLMWEVKTAGDGEYGNNGLHDADDRYTWYSGATTRNGGAVGDWNQRYDHCTGYQENQPITYCNTAEFLSRVNAEGWCGHKDWRIPTRPELESLVHFGRTRPAIHSEFFPNTKNEFYWSSSPVVRKPTSAWAVSFQFGFSAELQRSNSRPVRLVRSVDGEGM